MYNIKDFKGGWFIGNFEPTLLKTSDFEVAYKSYSKGQCEMRHLHKIAIEYTLIIEGEVLMNNIEYYDGDIIIIKPNQSTDFKALKDTKTLVVKLPSIPDDKYLTND